MNGASGEWEEWEGGSSVNGRIERIRRWVKMCIRGLINGMYVPRILDNRSESRHHRDMVHGVLVGVLL